MTKEDKQLLLADLCARSVYSVKINTPDGNQTMVGIICTNGGGKVYTSNMLYNINQVKPYLRPMSSMTEEEKKELRDKNILIAISTSSTVETTIDGFDWLNAHHFDYRGLIEKGFASEAPDGMYN